MFNNLIESRSHTHEFKRRGSFFLFTTASYALLFVMAGVVSIYAYDARTEHQNLEIVTMMPLVELAVPDQATPPTPPNRPISTTNADNNRADFQRKIAMAAVDEPTKVPEGIETKANANLPLPKHGVVRLGLLDSDPGPFNSVSGFSGQGQGNTTVLVPIETPPPPVPAHPPVPKVVRKPILNGEAKFLPKPPYPEMAKHLKIQGAVNVQVLIDETGRVVSAKAISGHALFVREAQKAALQALFGPTMFGDQPVKVSGVITYNFVLQQ